MSVDSPPSVSVSGYPTTTPNQQIDRQWRDDDQNIINHTFNTNNNDIGFNPDLIDILQNGTPLDYYHYIVSHYLIHTIVKETNRFAAEKLASKHYHFMCV